MLVLNSSVRFHFIQFKSILALKNKKDEHYTHPFKLNFI